MSKIHVCFFQSWTLLFSFSYLFLLFREAAEDDNSSGEEWDDYFDGIEIVNEETLFNDFSRDEVWKQWSLAFGSKLSENFQFRVRRTGITYADVGMKRPSFFYNLTFPEDAIKLMVDETNRFADRKRSLERHARRWAPVTVLEMRAFLLIHQIMSVSPKSLISQYWSSSKVHHNEVVAALLPLSRFEQILRYLHVSNTYEEDVPEHGKDKLIKIRRYLDLLLHAWQGAYVPGKELTSSTGRLPQRICRSFNSVTC